MRENTGSEGFKGGLNFKPANDYQVTPFSAY